MQVNRLPVRTVALYSLGLGFFGLVLWRSQIWEGWERMGEVGPLTLAVVPLLSLLMAIPLALRERLILRTLGRDHSAWSLVPIAYYGNAASFLTPVSSGEVLRPSLLERGVGVPFSEGIAVVLFERLFSMFQLALTGILALTWTGVLPWEISAVLLPIFIASPFLPLLTYRLLAALGSRYHFPLKGLSRFLPKRAREVVDGVRESSEPLQRLWHSPGLVVWFSLLTYAVFLVLILQFWLLIQGVGESISAQEVWVVLVASSIAGMLSGLPLGLGATDAVMVSLLGTYGIGASSAATVTLLMRCLINLPTGMLALGAYLLAVGKRPARPERLVSPENTDLVVETSPS